MPILSRWLRAFTEHVQQHWLQHLLPAAVMLIGLVLYGWGIMLAWLAIFGGTLLLLALELETAALICFFGISALGSFLMMLYQLAGAVFVIGYARYTLQLQQGQESSWRELLWGLRHPFRSVMMVFLLVFIVFCTAALFYIPLIFVGGWMMLCGPSLAQGDRGLLGSMGRAWSLSGRAYGELLLLTLGLLFLFFVTAMFPIVGPVLGPCAGVILGVVVFDDLSRG